MNSPDKDRLKSVYGDAECFELKPDSKEFVKGKPRTSPTGEGNRAARNATGERIVIDIDIRPDSPEKSADFEAFCAAFPGVADTPTMRVSSKTTGAFHLVYTWPEEYPFPMKSVAPGTLLGRGVEVPTYYTLPGSVVQGREYTDNGLEPAVIPDSLALTLLRPNAPAQIIEEHQPYAGTGGNAERLLKVISNAAPGERNAAYLKVAFPLLGILGADEFLHRLILAWPGDESEEELEAKVKSTVAAYSGSDTGKAPREVLYSRHRNDYLVDILNSVRYGSWKGRTAATDRRVMLALALKAVTDNQVVIDYSLDSVACDTGIYPSKVSEAYKRLVKLGCIGFPSKGDYSKISLAGWSESLGLLVLREITPTGLSHSNYLDYLEFKARYKYPYRSKSVLPALSPVWRHKELGGRCAQVFDLIDSGVSSRRELASLSGAGGTTVKDSVSRLIELGLVVDAPEGLSVCEDAASVAQGLCNQGEVSEVYQRIREKIAEDYQRRSRYHKQRFAEATAVSSMCNPAEQELLEQLGLV